MLTASDDCTARLWDAKTGKCIQTFAGHEDVVKKAIFSNDGVSMLTASFDTPWAVGATLRPLPLVWLIGPFETPVRARVFLSGPIAVVDAPGR